MSKKISKENGYAHLLIPTVVVLLAISAVGAWVFIKQDNPTELNLANKQGSNYKSLNSNDIARLKQTPQTNPAPAPTPSSVSPTPNSTPAPRPSPQPALVSTAGNSVAPVPSPYANWKVSFSADGCYVTVVATPGVSVEIGAHTATKGGSVQYVIPASGTLTKSSGGFKGMTSYGKTINSSGGAYGEATITTDQCSPAG